MQSKRSRHLNHPLKHVGQRQVGDGHVLLVDLHRPLKEAEQGEMKPVHHQTGNQRREIPLQQGQSKSQLIIPLDTAGGGGAVGRHKQMGSWDLGSCFQLDNEAEV